MKYLFDFLRLFLSLLKKWDNGNIYHVHEDDFIADDSKFDLKAVLKALPDAD